MNGERQNLLGLSRAQLEDFFAGLGEKPYRARQLMKWIYRQGEADFDQMSDISKALRQRLKEIAEIKPPEIVTEQLSDDGTRKWLLRTDADQAVEMVFIPEADRGTLCISSQVGCALDCSFCATGKQGFNRNLGSAEIAGQVWLAKRLLGETALASERVITNVVFMGMGEPLANYRNVVPVLQLLIDELGFELSRRRVTLSTSGLVPNLEKLADDCNVALAVSLHAPNDELRDRLVPINRKHPIRELLDACWVYAKKHHNRQITFEYVMMDGVNDSPGLARELACLLRDRPAKVNLIPFNPFPGTGYRCSPAQRIDEFRQILLDGGIMTTTRRTRGQDIDAACGQLAGRVKDRTTARLGDKLKLQAANA
ncbi:MAG: 23S rRNA (adenine(2503)-C(2))-methyltransferase RlmN [Gammaproteobacteria bacterium]|nr:23S rRNA (adenine(2503)-C(2))-methyltransferase RlmN [Gammaproteobacteria bacterium]MCZ6762971.1 23S rRNA (adenine(2503)-C(2))-methyltransferase RlmN [Gammaproteobacteria bacterium]